MPKQMTDADELAIWREIAKYVQLSCKMRDVHIRPCESGKKFEARKAGEGVYCDPIAIARSPVECIFQARQRLAEEREAKKSPREKRLEKILQQLLDQQKHYNAGPYFCDTHRQDVEAALKED